jgi:hypothetical protein
MHSTRENLAKTPLAYLARRELTAPARGALRCGRGAPFSPSSRGGARRRLDTALPKSTLRSLTPFANGPTLAATVPTVNKKTLNIVIDLMSFGGVAFFLAAYAYFFWDIWTLRFADKLQFPTFDPDLVYAAGLVGGILGTYFAVQIGVQKSDTADDGRVGLGDSLLSRHTAELLGTIAVVAYFLVGVWSLVTVWFCRDQSPEAIKALAAVFGGYFILLFSKAFGTSTTPAGTGTTPEPQLPPDAATPH